MENIGAAMKRSCKVYFGPSTSSYAEVGSVSAGEAVQAHWTEVSGSWTYITYNVSNNPSKAGYVKSADVNANGNSIPAQAKGKQWRSKHLLFRSGYWENGCNRCQ